MKEERNLRGDERGEEKRPYTPPAIICTTQITTRAGSPLSTDRDADPVDPADLFDD